MMNSFARWCHLPSIAEIKIANIKKRGLETSNLFERPVTLENLQYSLLWTNGNLMLHGGLAWFRCG